MTGKRMTSAGSHVTYDHLQVTNLEDSQLGWQFKLGDIAWVRIHDRSWWPAQVVGGNCTSLRDEKNKGKGEVLVRLYGTYDYTYVDPVKCCSEFEHNLKKEKNSKREAFQKALEEDISRLMSGGKSKRKASNYEESPTAEPSKGKRHNQDRSERDKEANHPASTRSHPSKSKEVCAEQQENDKSNNEALGDEKSKKQGKARKLWGREEVSNESSTMKRIRQGRVQRTEKAKHGTCNSKRMKHDTLRQMKHLVVKENPIKESLSTIKLTVPQETALDEIRDLEEDVSSIKAGGNRKRKFSGSKDDKGKSQKQAKTETNHEADGPASGPRSGKSEQVETEQKEENSTKSHKAKNLKAIGLVNDASKTNRAKQGGGKLKEVGNAKPVVSITKRVKQDGSRQAKHKGVKESPIVVIPSHIKCDVLEKTTSIKKLDSSQKKSGGRSRRKASGCEENGTTDDSKGERQKQSKKERNREADDRPSARGYASGSKKVYADEKGKGKARDQASVDKKAKKDQVRKPVTAESSKRTISEDLRVKQGRAKKAIQKKTKKDQVRKPVIAESSKHGTSKDPSVKQGRLRKVIQKANNGANSRPKKQDRLRQSKRKDTEEDPEMESPVPNKGATWEKTTDLSARRTRVMQSLGLIAPRGSPFNRNGYIMTALQDC